jgi:hypothetical protein
MEKRVIYAVDFDGTLCESNWPDIGKPNIPLIEFLKAEQKKGNKVILWTMREGDLLAAAEEWLYSKFDFMPDAVNDNLAMIKKYYGNNPRKVFANVYIDDHNARYGVCAELPFTDSGAGNR